MGRREELGPERTALLGQLREEVLRRLCELATAKDDLPDKLYESVMERERMMPTDYGSHVAIPHPSHVMTEDTHVYVAVLAHPVYWSRQEVQVVILTLIGRREGEDLQKYYEATTEWIADEEAVRQLAQSPDYLTFMKLLQRK